VTPLAPQGHGETSSALAKHGPPLPHQSSEGFGGDTLEGAMGAGVGTFLNFTVLFAAAFP